MSMTREMSNLWLSPFQQSSIKLGQVRVLSAIWETSISVAYGVAVKRKSTVRLPSFPRPLVVTRGILQSLKRLYPSNHYAQRWLHTYLAYR